MVRMEGQQQPQEKTRVLVNFTFSQKEGNPLKYPKSRGGICSKGTRWKTGDFFWGCVVFWMHRCYTKGIRKNSSLACSPKPWEQLFHRSRFWYLWHACIGNTSVFRLVCIQITLDIFTKHQPLHKSHSATEIPTLNSSEPKMESVGRQSFLFRSMFKGIFC